MLHTFNEGIQLLWGEKRFLCSITTGKFEQYKLYIVLNTHYKRGKTGTFLAGIFLMTKGC